MSLIVGISKYFSVPLLSIWISKVDLLKFDSSLSNKKTREVLIAWYHEYSNIFGRQLFRSVDLTLTVRIIDWAVRRNFDWIYSLQSINVNHGILKKYISCDLRTNNLSFVSHTKELNVSVYNESNLPVLIALLPLFSNLEILNCKRAPIELYESMGVFTSLTSIDFSGCYGKIPSNGFVTTLKNNPMLSTINFDKCFIKSGDIQCLIIHNTRVTSLSLRDCSLLSQKDISMLIFHAKLKLSHLACNLFNDLTFTQFIDSQVDSQMTSLNLSECHKISSISANRLHIAFPRLTYVDFGDCSLVDDDVLMSLSKLHYLKDCLLSLTPLVTALGAMNIARNCIKLSTLSFYKTETNFEVSNLGGLCTSCPTLIDLILVDIVGLTDDILLSILGQSCNLIKLMIRVNDNITDKSIVDGLKCAPSLQELNFSECSKITDVSLTAVKLHPKLKVLFCVNCKCISRHAVNEFRNSRIEVVR